MNTLPKILIAVDELPAPCWNSLQGEYQLFFARDGYQAEKMLTQHRYFAVFLDIYLFGVDGLHLLRSIQQNQLCDNVVLTSETPSFDYAREGLLCGACDYILRPFQATELQRAFSRIRRQSINAAPLGKEALSQASIQTVCEAVGTASFEDRLSDFFSHLVERYRNHFELDRAIRQLQKTIVEQTFTRYPWLNLYYSPAETCKLTFYSTSPDFVLEQCRAQLKELHQAIQRLHPTLKSEKLIDIIEFMLSHVDDAPTQKELAGRFFVSSSTLSSYFSVSPLQSYRAYQHELRMTRAEYLLRSTDRRLYEICELLGFRDVNYFSQQFKQRNHCTVSEYRNTDSGDYQI